MHLYFTPVYFGCLIFTQISNGLGFFIIIMEGREMDDQELLTVSEMAAVLKVKPSWLYFRTMKKGEGAIPRIRIGKYLRFNPVEVMAWIQEKYGDGNK